MTRRDRDRLVALKKAKKGLITQREAAEELGRSERHIRRLLVDQTLNGASKIRCMRSNLGAIGEVFRIPPGTPGEKGGNDFRCIHQS